MVLRSWMTLGPLPGARPGLLDPVPMLATPGTIERRRGTAGNGSGRCRPERCGAERPPCTGDARRLRRPRRSLLPRDYPLTPIAPDLYQAQRAVLSLAHQHPTLRRDPAPEPAVELQASPLVCHHVIIPDHARGLQAKDVGIRSAAGRPRLQVGHGGRRRTGTPPTLRRERVRRDHGSG